LIICPSFFFKKKACSLRQTKVVTHSHLVLFFISFQLLWDFLNQNTFFFILSIEKKKQRSEIQKGAQYTNFIKFLKKIDENCPLLSFLLNFASLNDYKPNH